MPETTKRAPFWAQGSFWITQAAAIGLCLAQTYMANGTITLQTGLICVTPLLTTLAGGVRPKPR